MSHYDVFNGDADGICALHQLRLCEPRESLLISGVKRDINLLRQVDGARASSVTALDISLDVNRDALLALLARGIHVQYFDHHYAGEIPAQANLQAHIDPSAEICSGLLVDAYLGGAQRPWAVVAAFGDNLHASARRAAAPLQLRETPLQSLAMLGTLLNYNGYGETLEDLFFPPVALYQSLREHLDPFTFIAEEPAYATLRDGYREDMAQAEGAEILHCDANVAVLSLPAARWARRVAGSYANHLAQAAPERAHALCNQLADGGYRVSVRAPLAQRMGADQVCRQFATGGGRRAAAGINHLPASALPRLLDCLRATYAG